MINRNNQFFGAFEAGDSFEDGKSGSQGIPVVTPDKIWNPWLDKPTMKPLLPAFVFDAQVERVPPPLDIYQPCALNQTTIRDLITVIKVNEDPDHRASFSTQIVTEENRKVFPYTNPTAYSAEFLLSNEGDSVISQILNDPRCILSLKMNPKGGLVMVDLDPTPSARDRINFAETPLLTGLPELCDMDPGNTGEIPLVTQSPRGLHLLFKNNPDIQPQIGKGRDYQVHLGLNVELINNGWCGLIGRNYRLITPVGLNKKLPRLPFGFWPIPKQTAQPIILENIIPIGNRWNTLTKGIGNRQFVYKAGAPLVKWVHRYFCDQADGGLLDYELQSLVDSATRAYGSLAKVRFSTNFPDPNALPRGVKQMIEVLPSDPSLLGQLTRVLGGDPRPPERGAMMSSNTRLLSDFVSQKAFISVAHQLPLSAIVHIYQLIHGIYLGAAKAFAVYWGGEGRYLIYNQEIENFMMYNYKLGIWEVVADTLIETLIRDVGEFMGQLDLQELRTIKALVSEIKARVAVPNWGKKLSGFSYLNGCSLLGNEGLVDAHPELQLVTTVDNIYEANALFSNVSEAYFKNLVYFNPPQLHLFRMELFKTLYSVGKPSHFIYLMGPPKAGKSLCVDIVGYIMGPDSMYRIDAGLFSEMFGFSDIKSTCKFAVFEDADRSTNAYRVLSFLKERSTAAEFFAPQKFRNKRLKVTNLHWMLVSNSFLPSNELAEALERRQIIISPQCVSEQEQISELLSLLKQNTSAIQNWVNRTPHVYSLLAPYTGVMNYMNTHDSYEFNQVGVFLMSSLKKFFFTPGKSHPVASVPAEGTVDKKAVLGLYEAFLQHAADSTGDPKAVLKKNEFQAIFLELVRNVLFLPAEEDGTHTETKTFKGDTDRVCIRNITYAVDPEAQEKLLTDGFRNLVVRMPLNAAVIALLHPATIEVNDFKNNSYSPGITVHQWYPADWLAELYKVIQGGPTGETEAAVLNYQKTVAQVLQQIEIKSKSLSLAIKAWTNKKLENGEGFMPALEAAAEESSVSEGEKQLFSNNELNLPSEITPFTFKGLLNKRLEDLPKSLDKMSSAQDVYERLLAMQELSKTSEKPDIIIEKRRSKEARTYITKTAYNKLAQIWVVDVGFNDQPSYKMARGTPFEEILLKNEDAPGPRIELVYDQDTIIDIMMPAGESASEAKHASLQYEGMHASQATDAIPSILEVADEGVSTTAEQSADSEGLVPMEGPGPMIEQPQVSAAPVSTSLVEGETAVLPAGAPDRGQISPPTEVLKDAGEIPSLASPKAKPGLPDLLPGAKEALAEDVKGPRETFIRSSRRRRGEAIPILEIQPFVKAAFDDGLWVVDNESTHIKAYFEYCKKKSVGGPADRKSLKIAAAEELKALMDPAGDYTTSFSFNSITCKALRNACLLFLFEKKGKYKQIPAIRDILGNSFTGDESTNPSISGSVDEMISYAFGLINKRQNLSWEELLDTLLERFIWKSLVREANSRRCKLTGPQGLFTVGNSAASYSYFESLAEYDWGIEGLTKDSFKKPFEKSVANEAQREHFANWTSYVTSHIWLNKLLGDYFVLGGLIVALVNNFKDLLTVNFTFSSKTGTRKSPFSWKKCELGQPFSLIYKGDKGSKDPGRLSIQGQGFTTMPKIYREALFSPILGTFAKQKGVSFFVLDLKGAHAAFQAALLKDETPILYKIYQSTEPEIWLTFVEKSAGSLTLDDKPSLKTLFYAALNGGSIATAKDCERHLMRTNMTEKQRSRLTSFIAAFLRHPITKELEKVSSYWESLNGELFVPTHEGVVRRVLDQAGADKINEGRDTRARAAGRADSRPLATPGEAIPRQLPTLYYTSLEVCIMSKIVGWTVMAAKSLGLESCWPIQGVHDGFIFVASTSEKSDIIRIKDKVNESLANLAQTSLGVPLSVSLSYIESGESHTADWLISPEEGEEFEASEDEE